ncbi:hypothetical protein M422DRAFT_25406, partial [Sphaerobolus stellatus SS14]
MASPGVQSDAVSLDPAIRTHGLLAFLLWLTTAYGIGSLDGPVTGRRGTENAQLVPHWGRWSIKLHCVQDGTRHSVRVIISLEQDAKQGAYLWNALSPVLQHHRFISKSTP